MRGLPPLLASASTRSLLSLRSRATGSARDVSRRVARIGRRLASRGMPPLLAAPSPSTRSLLSLRSSATASARDVSRSARHVCAFAVVVVLTWCITATARGVSQVARIGRALAVRELPPLPASASARSLLSLRSRATASARGVSRRFARTGRRLASRGIPPLPAATQTRSLLSLRSARNRLSPRRLTDHPHLNPCAVVVVQKALPLRPVASHSTSRSGRCQHQLAAAAARGRDHSLAVVVMDAHYRLGQ